MWRNRNGYLVPALRGIWARVVKPVVTEHAVDRVLEAGEVRVALWDTEHFEENCLFFDSYAHSVNAGVTFAGRFGWELIFVGGALVLAGSILAAVDAASSR
jgi:hypothetical protein